MEENNHEHREEHPYHKNHGHHDHSHAACWIKFLASIVAAFIGAFLACYIVMDRMGCHHMHRPHFKHHKIGMNEYTFPDIDKIIKKQGQIFDDITKFETNINPFMVRPVKIQTFKDNDAYKIIVDLRPFDGNPDKIKMDIKPHTVKLSGESDMASKDGSRDIMFMQNFSLPKKIKVKDVKKEVEDGNYIITLPIED